MAKCVTFVLLLALLLIVALAVPSGLRAEDDHTIVTDVDADASMEQESAVPRGHQFTSTCLIPQSPVEHTVAAGETVDLLLGVMNDEAKDSGHVYRAEYAVAYLLNVDPAFAIQNFTGVAYSRTVQPNEAATLRYRIRPDARLEPKDYQLMVQLFYMNERDETFLATPFNKTITITDALGNSWDLVSLMHYGGIVALLGLAILLPLHRVWSWARRNGYIPGGQRSKSSKSSRSTGSRLAVDPKAELDWSYVSAEHRQYAQRSSGKAKKN